MVHIIHNCGALNVLMVHIIHYCGAPNVLMVHIIHYCGVPNVLMVHFAISLVNSVLCQWNISSLRPYTLKSTQHI